MERGQAPNSVSKIDLKTGNVSTGKVPRRCVRYKQHIPTTKTLYLLVNGNTLRSFPTNNTFGKNDVTIDISGCDSGSGCFDELHCDAKNVADGDGGATRRRAKNSIVSIGVILGRYMDYWVFSQLRRVLESSTFYTDMQQQFGWLSCLIIP